MKKVPLYFLCLVCYLLSCQKNTVDQDQSAISQEDSLGIGWRKVSIGGSDNISDIHFHNNIGFAAAGFKILKSIDGGNNWELATKTDYPVFNISMGNTNNVIAVSRGKRVYFSNDGGLNFEFVTLNDEELNEIFFLNDTIAYAMGLNLWKTIDAGRHWQKITEFTNQTGIRTYRTVYFINELLGWVISPNGADSTVGLFKTEDGGVNWKMLISGDDKLKVNSLFFVDEKNGFTNGVPNLLKTVDGGDTWELIRKGSTSGLGDVRYGDLHFLSKDVGYISDCKNIYKTTNGGISFIKEVSLNVNNPDADIIELYFTDANHGWACGYKGYILKYEK